MKSPEQEVTSTRPSRVKISISDDEIRGLSAVGPLTSRETLRKDETVDEAERFAAEPLERQFVEPTQARASGHSEEVQRVQVEEEDRLAFRVGVNILTLVLIGVAAYLVWRNFFQ